MITIVRSWLWREAKSGGVSLGRAGGVSIGVLFMCLRRCILSLG